MRGLKLLHGTSNVLCGRWKTPCLRRQLFTLISTARICFRNSRIYGYVLPRGSLLLLWWHPMKFTETLQVIKGRTALDASRLVHAILFSLTRAKWLNALSDCCALPESIIRKRWTTHGMGCMENDQTGCCLLPSRHVFRLLPQTTRYG